ncbi:MAG: hypothetical protein U5J83_07490 [Bryobacterales bacterium]|nr:hypothetical protein [Bryobacterales bacterium]
MSARVALRSLAEALVERIMSVIWNHPNSSMFRDTIPPFDFARKSAPLIEIRAESGESGSIMDQIPLLGQDPRVPESISAHL